MNIEHMLPAGAPSFKDHLDTKAKDWLKAWDGSSRFDLGVVGVPLSKTSISHSGAFGFPASVRQALTAFGTYNMDADIDLADRLAAADVGDIRMHTTDLPRCHVNIYEALKGYWATAPRSTLFLVGGDHSITAPSVQAFVEQTGQEVAIIHFDAHHDMRNLEDGGPTNGTPFRRLLEGGALKGNRLIQIGLRSFVNSKAYTDYAKSHGVHLITMNQVYRQGLASVLANALTTVAGDGVPVYVSFDLDVLDPAFAPGVPAPAPGGMTVWQAFEAMEWLGQQTQVKAFDWVCADPTQDVRNLTSRVAAQMMLFAATGMARRG